MQPDNDEYPGYRQTIEVALNTIRRMVIDIAYAFNREIQNVNIDFLAPTITHIARSAEQHISAATVEDLREERWMQDFEQLRRVLGWFNKRWVLAGEFLFI